MSGTVLWAVVLAGGLGCYLLKLAGLSVPAGWVERPWVARTVDFVPAALLAALVAVQAGTSGPDLVLDGRLAGLAVAALALALRAPFVVVLALAGAAGALVHALGSGHCPSGPPHRPGTRALRLRARPRRPGARRRSGSGRRSLRARAQRFLS